MTGAGFGGCGIAIVHKDKVEAFTENVGKTYTEVVGYEPSFMKRRLLEVLASYLANRLEK